MSIKGPPPFHPGGDDKGENQPDEEVLPSVNRNTEESQSTIPVYGATGEHVRRQEPPQALHGDAAKASSAQTDDKRRLFDENPTVPVRDIIDRSSVPPDAKVLDPDPTEITPPPSGHEPPTESSLSMPPPGGWPPPQGDPVPHPEPQTLSGSAQNEESTPAVRDASLADAPPPVLDSSDSAESPRPTPPTSPSPTVTPNALGQTLSDNPKAVLVTAGLALFVLLGGCLALVQAASGPSTLEEVCDQLAETNREFTEELSFNDNDLFRDVDRLASLAKRLPDNPAINQTGEQLQVMHDRGNFGGFEYAGTVAPIASSCGFGG